MKYTIYIETDNHDLSPKELADLVNEALAQREINSKVRCSCLDTIIWVDRQEHLEGITRDNAGYGKPRHLSILRRAGYGS